MNGRPSVGLWINKQTGANTVKVSERVLKELQTLKKELPQGIEVGVAFDQAEYVRQSISNMAGNTLQGGFLAVAVLYLFLRNFRSTMIIGLAIPISIIRSTSSFPTAPSSPKPRRWPRISRPSSRRSRNARWSSPVWVIRG